MDLLLAQGIAGAAIIFSGVVLSRWGASSDGDATGVSEAQVALGDGDRSAQDADTFSSPSAAHTLQDGQTNLHNK